MHIPQRRQRRGIGQVATMKAQAGSASHRIGGQDLNIDFVICHFKFVEPSPTLSLSLLQQY
jgi:hypothetical protein